MTTPAQQNWARQSTTPTQPRVKPIWPFVAVIITTLLLWNPYTEPLTYPIRRLLRGVPLITIGSLATVAASVAMVWQERANAAVSASRRPIAPAIAVLVAVVLISLPNTLAIYWVYRGNYGWLTTIVGTAAVITAVAAAIACVVIRSHANKKFAAVGGPQPAAPIGYTTEGQPIYPVVGYTPDGQPVTADRAVGITPTATGTNGMAIAALITGLTMAPLGIIFGHIALSQIKRTGQDGRGMAIAGLVLGYVSLASSIVIFAIIAAQLH